jgi:hypothetical protein
MPSLLQILLVTIAKVTNGAVRNESLGLQLELIRVAENHLGQRSTTARVVNNLLHDTANVSMSLGLPS